MNPPSDALVQQMLQQNQMLTKMVLAQQSGSQQPIQPPVFIQPVLPPGPAILPGPAVPAEPVEQGEEQLEILPENVRPFEHIELSTLLLKL